MLTNADLLAALTGHRGPAVRPGDAGLRFAFYGRMSTSTFQDVQTSRAWQRAVSDELIEGVGAVVSEYFDVGVSRRWSWQDRPEAASLLAAAAAPDREFDAVVVGEYERAFHGDQFREVFSRLNALGVAVWLPEAGGPVELGSPVHEALMVLLGAQAQREVARARQRVLAAMRAQTRLQGRFLGGRPPYGYRLVDGGRHPNPVHGRWGRRVQVLAPDPMTAPWVRWMFSERARGRTVASLARELNERGVACPSGADPERNEHRSGDRWIVRTVAMILENPRYTGRQVWNRTSTTGHGSGGRAGGRGSGAPRWNPVSEWEVSERIAHEPLVDDETFVAVQGMRVAQPAKDGEVRHYLLAGLVVCGLCGRRMDGHWVHGRAGYRCRHGFTSARRRPDKAPRNFYVREDHLLEALPGLLEHPTGPVTQDMCAELVYQVRGQGLQIEYGDQRLRLRSAPPVVKAAESARRRVQPTLALDWSGRKMAGNK
ncbi:recombinase family protein [Lentzea sp. NPDC051838]|uniref:recombinase family protein n=1 Tax=Lentzea sp. NPDC051838 TaxID=3154849 RepID=UPI003449129C